MHLLSNRLYKNFSASNLTRIKTGGKLEYYVQVSDKIFLTNLIDEIIKNKKKFIILGAGSNVIFSDHYYDGIVIRLGEQFRGIEIRDGKAICGAGTFLPKLGWYLSQGGYPGFEFMCAIPGTIGGAVKVNAGTTMYGKTSDNFLSALILDIETNTIKKYSYAQMKFGYRTTSLLYKNCIILEVIFDLKKYSRTDPFLLKKNIKKLEFERRKKQPLNTSNFGSTFKSTGSNSAGWYLDKVGMKGVVFGDAQVANEHANWIVNLGNASSKDVKELISMGSKRVYDAFGIYLEREVVYLPEDLERM